MEKGAGMVLIRNAEIWDQGITDVRVQGTHIAAIGALSPLENERIIDARGGALFPGLHDHHIHLAATAVAGRSLLCGPPDVMDAPALIAALQRACAAGTLADGWLRGIGYHESVAGMLDAATLDRWLPDQKIRIQHRSGRMWFLNSLALQWLLERSDPPAGLERDGGSWTGRLFDEDYWLRQTLAGSLPCIAELSQELLSYGVTGVTDMTPSNDGALADQMRAQQRAGKLRQKLVLAGQLDLAEAAFDDGLQIGPAKLHLHEWQLPEFDAMTAFITESHAQGRGVAVHCTTEVELVFALAGLRAAGASAGDRIEHGGIATDELIQQISDLGISVVSQPHFIAERGDQYLRDVEPHHHPHLYRLAAFSRAGVRLAGGSDAPYGSHDPWASMRASVDRKSYDGQVIGASEALTPEQAITLYLHNPLKLGDIRAVTVGAAADLMLLDRPWQAARNSLLADHVAMTMVGGSILYQRVD